MTRNATLTEEDVKKKPFHAHVPRLIGRRLVVTKPLRCSHFIGFWVNVKLNRVNFFQAK